MMHGRTRFCWPRAVALAPAVFFLLTHARQARPRRRNQQGKRATGDGVCWRTSSRFKRASRPVHSFESVADRPVEAHHIDQGGLRQLRAAVEVAQEVGP